MKKCVIVIPVYKQNPEISELASFKQCLSILNKYDIVIITYQSLSIDSYINESNNLNISLKIEYFEEKYFKSVYGYNQLCLNKELYLRFSNYEYMLIYQLDAWAFEDKIDYWCSKEYDYIGAPIFDNKGKLLGVGNGGLSLRKIEYCLKVLNRPIYLPYVTPKYLFYLYKYDFITSKHKSIKDIILILFKIISKSVGYKNNIKYYSSSKGDVNEDLLFSVMARHAWGVNINMPTINESIDFAFERFPSELYVKNNKRLPFGCHAFEKWEFKECWSKFIKY